MSNADMGGVGGGERYDVAKHDEIERAFGQSPTPTDIDPQDTKLGAAFEAHYAAGELGQPNPLSVKPYGTQGDVDDADREIEGEGLVGREDKVTGAAPNKEGPQ